MFHSLKLAISGKVIKLVKFARGVLLIMVHFKLHVIIPDKPVPFHITHENVCLYIRIMIRSTYFYEFMSGQGV